MHARGLLIVLLVAVILSSACVPGAGPATQPASISAPAGPVSPKVLTLALEAEPKDTFVGSIAGGTGTVIGDVKLAVHQNWQTMSEDTANPRGRVVAEAGHPDALADKIARISNPGASVYRDTYLGEKPAGEHRNRGQRFAAILGQQVMGHGLFADVVGDGRHHVPEHRPGRGSGVGALHVEVAHLDRAERVGTSSRIVGRSPGSASDLPLVSPFELSAISDQRSAISYPPEC